MPVTLKGQSYYRTAEVCRVVGISRSTLLRWLRDGVLRDLPSRDRRRWRLFTETDVKRIEEEACQIR